MATTFGPRREYRKEQKQIDSAEERAGNSPGYRPGVGRMATTSTDSRTPKVQWDSQTQPKLNVMPPRQPQITSGATQPPVAAQPQSVANPPPTGNIAPQYKTQVQLQNPKAYVNPYATGRESAADFDTGLARSMAFAAPHDSTVAPAAPVNLPTPNREAMLDAALAPQQQQQAEQTGQQNELARIEQTFGTPKPATPAPRQLSVAPENPNWQQEAIAANPEIAKAGSPANIAFIEQFWSRGGNPNLASALAAEQVMGGQPPGAGSAPIAQQPTPQPPGEMQGPPMPRQPPQTPPATPTVKTSDGFEGSVIDRIGKMIAPPRTNTKAPPQRPSQRKPIRPYVDSGVPNAPEQPFDKRLQEDEKRRKASSKKKVDPFA